MAEANSTQSPDGGQEPVAGLSEPNLELLALLGQVFQDYHPRPGALDDVPQVTVDPGDTLQVCRLAKEDSSLRMTQLLCLACVDYQEYLQLVYILHSLEPERTLAIKTDVPYGDPRVPSVTSVWRAADWYEREAHDLFGVFFDGHPDLSPLLLYEGFEGFPGRREFPFNDYQEF